MPFSNLSAASAGSSDGNSVTTSGVNTAGVDLIVLAVASYQAVADPTISDSKGNTWTPRTSYASDVSKLKIYYAVNPTVGSGHTFTASQSGSYPSIIVLGFSGSHATPFDQENGNTSASASSLATGSVTPTEDNELIIMAACHSADISSCDEGTGGPLLVAYVNGEHFAGGADAEIQTTAAAINPTWTFAAAASCAVAQATFKAAAAAGGQPTMRRWGGVPHMAGGQQVNHGGSGRMWGRRRSGLIVPQRFREAA